jgi:hypothetical protein
MSETQTQSYNPASKSSRRNRSVLVWLLALLVAFTAVVGAVWAVGGPDEARKMLSLPAIFSGSSGSQGGSSSSSVATPPSGSSATTDTGTIASSTLPSDAQERMFVEQMESRAALTDLVEGKIASFSIGTPVTTDTSATLPLTVTYISGSNISGRMAFLKSYKTWYFFSISGRAEKQSGDVASPEAFDSGVVSTITGQQAEAGTQDMIAKGLLGGGYKTVKVNSVKMGRRTATVDVSLSGGSQPAADGRLVCISKTEAKTTYWFVASFEKR